MLKYVDTKVTFSEIPDEITLCISLSNCPCHCKGCHSSYLADDIGEILTFSRIVRLLEQNQGASAICFMGGDNDPKLVNHYASLIKSSQVSIDDGPGFELSKDIITRKGVIPKGTHIQPQKYIPSNIKVGWYSGRQELAKEINLSNFDYIKLGPYIEELGGLDCKTTNQKFYHVFHFSSGKNGLLDWTHKFWKNND